MDNWITLVLSLMSIVIPVFATIYTVNNRIRNENKEAHKPYLVLNELKTLNEINIYSYYLTPISRNYREKYGNEIKNSDSVLNIELILENVGYGIASNIKFYDLLTGEGIKGTQTSTKEQDQKLFTTFDIAVAKNKKVQAQLFNLLLENDGMVVEDHNRILCIYQDLNSNVYSFIISINIKAKGHYDFFTYQQTSKSYKKWIKENKKEFNKIVREYTTIN